MNIHRIGQRITDVFHIDFLDYMQSSPIKSELQEQTETFKKAISDLKGELTKLNKNLESLPALANATGLDLSFTTLKNLRHLLQNDEFEKLDPNHCSADVFQEILGIDFQLAHRIRNFFWYPEESAKLEDIEGMDSNLMEKFGRYFTE